MSAGEFQKLNTTNTVGEWVAADFRLAPVFAKHGIDFCCGGNKAVGEACAEKGVSVEALLQEAGSAREMTGIGEQYNQWSLDFLADYIVNQFHGYTREMLPQIASYANAVAHAHGAGHPETVRIAELWGPFQQALTAHLDDEEARVFPAIKQLAQRGQGPAAAGSLGDVPALISALAAEHDEAGATLAEIERLSGGYAVPADGCNSYRALYGFLQEFEAGTKKHIHLENNILFPKTLKLGQA